MIAPLKTEPPRFLLIGFGAVGQGLVPLMMQALGIAPTRITAWAADLQGEAVAQSVGISLRLQPLTPDNHAALLNAQMTASKGVIRSGFGSFGRGTSAGG